MSDVLTASWSAAAMAQLTSLPDYDRDLQDYRRKKIADFQEAGWPTRRSESWKYTRLKHIAEQDYTTPVKRKSDLFLPVITDEQIEIFIVDGSPCLDGLDSVLPAGFDIMPLDTFMRESPKHYLGAMTEVACDGLSYLSLNQGLSSHGLVIRLAPKVRLNKALRLHYVFSKTSAATMQHWQQLIFLGDNASLELITDISSDGDQSSLITMLQYFQLQRNSTCHYFFSTNLSKKATLLSSMQVASSKNSELNHFLLPGCAQLSRFDDIICLNEKHARATAYQLCYAQGEQQIDSQLTVRHLAESTASTPVLRGIVDNRASVTFNGNIYVAENAPGAQAMLHNKNLLLSSQAVINTKPDLEIYTDDVTCSHGATIGELDQEALFYLRSRGLDEEAARAILLQGFLSEIIEDFPVKHWCGLIKTCLVDLMLEDNNE